jgi:release factor glutamine methyltransferase
MLAVRPRCVYKLVGQALACGGLQPAQTGDIHSSLTIAAPLRILDIGTGSGILAVTLALETGMETFATDISSDALRIANRNASTLNARCRFVRCDLGSAFADSSFDLIVSNPPYIESSVIGTLQREVRDWEPHLALDGGPSGLEIYARLIPEAARLLRPGGWLLLEIGATQGETVPALFDGSWQTPEVVNDLAGLPRVVKAQRSVT